MILGMQLSTLHVPLFSARPLQFTFLARQDLHLGKCRSLKRYRGSARFPTQWFAQSDRNNDANSDNYKARRYIEDELRDPSNFVEYLLPRPLRLLLTGFGSASCLVATVISATRYLLDYKYQTGDGDASTTIINLLGCITFGALFFLDRQAGSNRLIQREKVRKAQLAIGDREIVTTEEGERVSRLKEVNSDWIIRRLERWGRKDALPFIGPEKGALLQQLVRDKQPRLAVEVGTLCGYSTLLMAQAMSPDAQLISLESDWKWALVAKRFMYQASTGDRSSKPADQRIPKVDVWWADALQVLPSRFSDKGGIDLLFLDGLPSQYLAYLKAAEPHLAPGALVVADNAGIFGQRGLKEYLQYVRSSGKYSSEYLESTLEWRDDVPDGLEVSKLL